MKRNSAKNSRIDSELSDPVANGSLTAGEIYLAHITDLVKSEFERRQRLENRGQAVMTTSSGLLTLFVAIATFMAHEGYHFANCAAVFIICISFGVFVIAAALGIAAVNAFTTYIATSDATVDDMVGDHWDGDVDEARWICAKRQIETIKSLRVQNRRKGRLALAGPITQLGAITLLAIAVLIEVLTKFG